MRTLDGMVRKEDLVALANFRKALRKYLRFVEEGARAAGVTPQQHQVLLAVGGQPGRDWATVGEIAEFLQLRHHAAVGLADRCEAAGLVVRSAHETDRRFVKVALTSKGREVLEQLSLRNLPELQGALVGLTEDLEALSQGRQG